MFGLKKSPLSLFSKHKSAKSESSTNSQVNPFDSGDELDPNRTVEKSKTSSSEPYVVAPNWNPFEDPDDGSEGITPLSRSDVSSSSKSRYKNDFRDSPGLENQTVQGLENYAMYRAEETTKAVDNCLKIAENVREDAAQTLVTLHQQGEQITRTHMVAADVDHDLTRGEKLLGSLGGIFSRTWKPKKTRPIRGPVITRDEPVPKRDSYLEQRERLGLMSSSALKQQTRTRTPCPDPTNVLQKVEVEKAKQDNALSDLSNILSELKDMAIDMGSEIDRQNKALGHVQDDVEVLSDRVKGANQRARRLLRK